MILAEIQCLPTPSGTPERRHAHVEAAIAEIERSGLVHEVGALGTTVEGEPDIVWSLLRRVHEACLAAGAESTITVVKIAQAADPAGTPGIDDLTSAFREPRRGATPPSATSRDTATDTAVPPVRGDDDGDAGGAPAEDGGGGAAGAGDGDGDALAGPIGVGPRPSTLVDGVDAHGVRWQ